FCRPYTPHGSRWARTQLSGPDPPVPDCQISRARWAIWSWVTSRATALTSDRATTGAAAATFGMGVLRTGVEATMTGAAGRAAGAATTAAAGALAAIFDEVDGAVA